MLPTPTREAPRGPSRLAQSRFPFDRAVFAQVDPPDEPAQRQSLDHERGKHDGESTDDDEIRYGKSPGSARAARGSRCPRIPDQE